MNAKPWTREQLKLAIHLYCQLPFGKLHARNVEIIKLAKLIDRTPGAVAMKLSNFASLDPAITSTGRRGLEGASNLDRDVWSEFNENWEALALECARLRHELGSDVAPDETDAPDELLAAEDFTGETRKILTEQRIRQSFFRRAVLSSYRGRCCMSGVAESTLLVASHIVPWSKDSKNRLNPSNGLCLSAIHDRAFDKGLITVSAEFSVFVSERLRKTDNHFVAATFANLHGKSIELPERFRPGNEFLARHRREVFKD